jgi:hypothetical protein
VHSSMLILDVKVKEIHLCLSLSALS